MFPGRTFTVEFVLAALWRRKLWILVPGVIFAVSAAAVSLKLQNLYRSDTVILVIPQRVPESYVRTTVTQPIESRLRTISEQIRSRSRLERIIVELNLYGELRRTATMEEVVATMNKNISLQIGRGDSFTLGFTYSDPRLAAGVADRLAEMFITENLRDRESQAEGTSQFLETQLEAARVRLIEHEKKLEDYRRRHAGQLPSQIGTNLSVIQNAQQQIQSLSDATNRVRESRNTLQRQIADAEAVAAVPPLPPPSTGQDPTAAGTPAQQLEAARRALAALLARLTPSHPDVKRLQNRVAELEVQVKATPDATPAPGPRALTAAEVASANRLRELHAQLANLDQQIANNEAEQQRLRLRIADYQARVDALPSRESELAELTRDYATLQESYKSLLAKKEDSHLATSLERRQAGEQFKVLDGARVPQRPVSPNRPLIVVGGLFAGLVLGLLLAGGLELRDSSLRTEADVVQQLDLPVLVTVPIIVTAADVRRRRRFRLIQAIVVAAVVVSAGVAWWIVAGSSGVR